MDDYIQLQQNSQAEFEILVENYNSVDVLIASTDLPDIANVVSVGPIDANGHALITLKAMFTGTANLTVGIRGTDINKKVHVTVFSRSELQSNGGYSIVLNRRNNGVINCIITTIDNESVSAMIIAAAYDGNTMTHSAISNEMLMKNSSYEFDIGWSNLKEDTVIQIMIWNQDNLSPLTEPFVY